MTALFAETALLPEGWAENVRLEWDRSGNLVRVETGAPPGAAERAQGPVLPGMPNLHSHAFQRAMAGLTERAAGGEDSFWTWRETMYGFVCRIGPEELRAVAAQLYVEMLKAGYTAVAEFHYLHHDRDGTPYADRCTLSEAVLAAAGEAGIGMTLLPVLYQTGGFGAAPAGEGQRRFLNGTEEMLGMIAELRRRHGRSPQLRIGLAPHSLRAVTPGALRSAISGLAAMDASAPIHIHIAEQVKEVDDCLAWCGRRPVEFLLGGAPVDRTWCLVHATHMSEDETTRLAATGAVAGLCPTTEANLGDGFFPLPRYAGAWGVGSDSHISVSPLEELRWLEYGQRLLTRRRNVAAPSGSTGAYLWRRALAGGAQALGREIDALAPGRRADLVVLDPATPALHGKSGDTLLDATVFAGNDNPVRDVMVGGQWAVRERRHVREDSVLRQFRAAMDRLLA